MGACHVGFIPVVLFLCGRYLCRFLFPLSLAFLIVGNSFGNPACPDFVPAATVPKESGLWGLVGTGPFIYGGATSACVAKYVGHPEYGAFCAASVGGSTAACKSIRTQTGACDLEAQTVFKGSGCPLGYTASGNYCNLTNAAVVECPNGGCATGSYAGNGSFTIPESSFGNPVCYNGCLVDSKGISGYAAGGVTGDWYQTGAQCSDHGLDSTPLEKSTPPSPTVNPKYNCVTDSHGDVYCDNRQKVGCGTVNGKEYCADQFPTTSGKCIYFGRMNFVCSSENPSATPKPEPINPPTLPGQEPPNVTIRIKLPGNGVGNSPGGVGPGGWPSGNAPGNGGWLPDGNGQDPGGDGNGNQPPGGNGDGEGEGTSGCAKGDACESTQQQVLSKLGEINENLKPGSGTYNLDGFPTTKTFGESWDTFRSITANGPLGALSTMTTETEGTCPTYEIPLTFLGTQYTLDAHCMIANQWGGALSAIMSVFWAIIALRIFFSA